MTKETKEDKEQQHSNNINIESIEFQFPIQQNPDIKIESKLENKNKKNIIYDKIQQPRKEKIKNFH